MVVQAIDQRWRFLFQDKIAPALSSILLGQTPRGRSSSPGSTAASTPSKKKKTWTPWGAYAYEAAPMDVAADATQEGVEDWWNNAWDDDAGWDEDGQWEDDSWYEGEWADPEW